jgi:hypothetical protein
VVEYRLIDREKSPVPVQFASVKTSLLLHHHITV